MYLLNIIVKPGLKERKAQQDRIAHAAPDGHNDVGFGGNTLHQHGVDRHTDDDEKCLEAQGDQRAQIVLAHTAPFLAHHGGHGDGRDAGDEVNLDHSAVDDDENADGQPPHGKAHHEGLQPQPQKRPHVHLQQPRLKVRDMVGKVDGGVAHDKAG